MEPKTPSLTAYDILGYIVPGLGLLALIDLSVVYHSHKEAFNYDLFYARYGGLSWTSLPPLFLLAYFLGHLVSFASASLIENHAKWLHGHPSKFLLNDPGAAYFRTSSRCPRASKCFRGLTFLLVWPVSIVDAVFTCMVPIAKNYTATLDKTVKQAVHKAFDDLYFRLGIDLPTKEADRYEEDIPRLALHDAIEAAHGHIFGLRNYVVLYGFLRSMTLLFILAAWGAVVHVAAQGKWCLLSEIFAVSCFAGFLCYAAFLKFWTRYHQESLMAFVAAYANRDHRVPEKEQTKARRSIGDH